MNEGIIKSILAEWGYEKTHLIGQGAFAKVYCVWDGIAGRFCACKVSKEQEMLKREATFLQRIRHPLFTQYYDVKCYGNEVFLFMEYVPGMTLEEVLKKKEGMSEQQAVYIVAEIAKGLCYLHEQNIPIIFCDVKPQNIMLSEKGRVKLLDFGSACEINTKAGVITGTVGYAAPEQWEGGDKVGVYSDVYALGRILQCTIKNKKIHRGLKNLIKECTRDDVNNRLPNMRSFLRGIEPYLEGNKCKILALEIGAYLQKSNKNKYIFRQNVLKCATKSYENR